MLEQIIEITDRIRLASLIAVLGSLGALYALIAGQLDYTEFAVALGAINAGAGVIGVARNGAGHGITPEPFELDPVDELEDLGRDDRLDP